MKIFFCINCGTELLGIYNDKCKVCSEALCSKCSKENDNYCDKCFKEDVFSFNNNIRMAKEPF